MMAGEGLGKKRLKKTSDKRVWGWDIWKDLSVGRAEGNCALEECSPKDCANMRMHSEDIQLQGTRLTKALAAALWCTPLHLGWFTLTTSCSQPVTERGRDTQFSSVAQSCLTLWPYGLQHTRLPCPSPTPGVYSNSCPSRQWCQPTISSSVVPFFSRLQSLSGFGFFFFFFG